jgi:hypothetical protein
MSSFFSDLDIQEENPKKQNSGFSFFSDLDQSDSEFEEKPSRIRSLISAPLKGAIKSVADFTSQIPFIAKPIPKEYGLALTEEFLPTQNELPERILERAGGIAPFAAIGGGGLVSSALRSLIGGASGQAAEELGGGETSQILAEMIGMSFPSLSKSILATKSQKPLVDFARKMGLSESEISPLIQGKVKENLVSKFGSGDKIRAALKKSREATGKIYTTLSESPIANQALPEEAIVDLMKGLKEQIKSLPSGVRKVAMRDMVDLFKGEVNGKNLINLYQDLNYYIRKGNPLLNRLKGPVEDAINKISPEFAEDFALTNKLWENSSRFGKKIKTDLPFNIKSMGRAGAIASGVFTGNYKPLLVLAGAQVAEPAISKLVTSPRLQNLSNQMIKSLNQSKFVQAKKIADILEKEFDKKLIESSQAHEEEYD